MVSPGTTGASLISHSVPPPSLTLVPQPPMPVPARSSVPLGQAPAGALTVGKQTSKKPLLTDTALCSPSKEMLLSVGSGCAFTHVPAVHVPLSHSAPTVQGPTGPGTHADLSRVMKKSLYCWQTNSGYSAV